MKQCDSNPLLSLDDLLKALVGVDSEALQQLDGQDIKRTIHFLRAARKRMDALSNKKPPQIKES